MTLSTQNLVLSYGDDPIIKDVSLTIDPTEITVIIGPNGSGKSTFMAALAGQLPIQSGTVSLKNQSICKWKRRELARELALLPQEPQAPDEILVRQMVSHGRFAHRKPLRGLSDADHLQIEKAMMQTQSLDLENRPVASLSGGQRQRVWIAMALAQAPKLLLLDEPTSFLDLGFQHQVLQLLHSLNRETGLGVVMILHDINQASFYADRIIAFQKGQVLMDGSPSVVMQSKTVSQLYGLPVDIYCSKKTARPYCMPSHI